jgi:hypothetical protein
MRHLALQGTAIGVIGEACRDERLWKGRAVGDGDRAAVAVCASAGVRREQLVAEHVYDHARHDLPIHSGGHADREQRYAVEEVDRSIERVDHPLETRAGGSRPLLFADESRGGRCLA